MTDRKSQPEDKAEPKPSSGGAAAYSEGREPGPAGSPVQIRPAGAESTRDDDAPWDERDEASDESFPASDASAKY